jgi:hypothetical protein
MQAQKNHDDAGDPGQQLEVIADALADRRRARAQGDEHRGEAQDESQGRRHDLARRLPAPRLLILGQFLQRQAAQIAQVRRHQREHAGRHEGQQPGGERAARCPRFDIRPRRS